MRAKACFKTFFILWYYLWPQK